MKKQKIVEYIKARYIRLVILILFIILGFTAALLMKTENTPFSKTWIIIPFICGPSAYHFFCPKLLSIRRLLSIISGYTMLASASIFVLTEFMAYSTTGTSSDRFLVLSIVLLAISVILFYISYYALRNDRLETKITHINIRKNIVKNKEHKKFKQKIINVLHNKTFQLIIVAVLVISIILLSVTQCSHKNFTEHQTTTSAKSSGGSHDSNFVTPEKYPERIVYVSKYKLIHSNTNCSGLQYYTTMKLEQAEREHYKYCSKCW